MAARTTSQDNVWNFLRQRGVAEESIARMQQDKIDLSLIRDIEDADLARYIPVYGDRIALRRYCLDKEKTKDKSSRMSLLEKLRKKLRTATTTQDEETEEEWCPAKTAKNPNRDRSRNAVKSSRKIELGWIHEGKQMRKRSGGGTRTLDVSKKSTKEDILLHAKELFFPGGESKMGKWENFLYDVYDFKEAKLDESITVGELYSLSKFGILRFYLSTTCFVESLDTDADVHRKSDNFCFTMEEEPRETSSEEHQDTLNEPQGEQYGTVENSNVDLTYDDSEVIVGRLLNVSSVSQLDDTVPVLLSNGDIVNIALYTSTPLSGDNRPSEIQIDDALSVEEVISSAPSTSIHVSEDHDQFTNDSNLDAGLDQHYVTVTLHRTNLLEEMICQFKDDMILKYPLRFSFVNERGADADGVSRDAFAAFWTEFLDSAAEGAEMRVPSLSSKWQEEEWKAVGRILAKGFLDHGYFPLRLAPAFTTALIFGEHTVSTESLFESLMLYLSQCERELITAALGGDLDSDGQDDLLDLLDRMGVKSVPSQANLKAILLQVAHKQIIQQPKYALDNMSAVAAELLKTTITTTEKIQNMYTDKKPTCRKVLKLIEASPETPAERQALVFLQQYVRGLDEGGLRRLLRFVTGSDVICVTKIEVMFTALEGLQRRPIAHTCGSVLELPCTYNSYPELRVEMENVLMSNYYTMDIV